MLRAYRERVHRGDIALLRLLGHEVTCHPGARLWQGRISDLYGQPVQARGWPEGGSQGAGADGRVWDSAYHGELVEIHPEPGRAPQVAQGFSGAGVTLRPDSPVAGIADGRVVGIITAARRAEHETNAYLMPVEVIASYLDPVRPFIDGAPTFDPVPGAAGGETFPLLNPESRVEKALQREIAGLFSGTWSGTLAAIKTSDHPSWLTRALETSNPATRARMSAAAVRAAEKVPSLPVGAIDLAVNAGSRSAAEVRRRIADKFALPETRLVDGLLDCHPAPVIVIREVTASAQYQPLMRDLLIPLASRARRRGLRLILEFDGEAPENLPYDLALGPDPVTSGTPREFTGTDEIRQSLAELAEAENHLGDLYADVADRIADVPPLPRREAPQLRVRLAAADARSTELETIHGRCAEALGDVRRTEARLLAARAEHDDLTGMLEAYRVRAERTLGPGDTSLSGPYGIAREALRTRPCDLAAAQAAVKAFTGAVWRLNDRAEGDETHPGNWRDTAPCDRPGCRGRIDDTGTCGTCRGRPLSGPGTRARAPGSQDAEEDTDGSPVPADPWWGRYLVTVDPATDRDPQPLETDVDLWPVHLRNCRYCEGPVGRYGRDDGRCPRCGTSFHFRPRLREGSELDNGRYTIRRLLSYGGFGWAYLADDSQLPRPAVIKGFMDEQVAETVEDEHETLSKLDHPSIVTIRGYMVTGEPSRRYLALDYISGGTLRPLSPSEPPEQLLALVILLLEALDYLHGKGFLHCDVKPENIVRTGAGIRLIDFGAVRKITDTGQVAVTTHRYAPPPGDPERSHPTAAFDLYSVGRTVEVLTGSHLAQRAGEPEIESLRRLVRRATARDPAARFTSARQFGDQLSGVIRQITRARTAHRSVLFGNATDSLSGRLGSAMPLTQWTRARSRGSRLLDVSVDPFRPPPPDDIAAGLPAANPGPRDHSPATATDHLRPCHAALRNHDPDAADRCLQEADLADGDWRRAWYRALIALARPGAPDRRAARAEPDFAAVRAAVPGELPPLLALGLCAELCGRPARAWMYYALVSQSDETFIAAHFGLARVLLTWGQREAAATALDQVPSESRFEPDARIGAIHCLAAIIKAGSHALVPSEEDVNSARRRRADRKLVLDAPSTALLDVELAYARASASRSGSPAVPSESDRRDLEGALRRAALVASTERVHQALIDLANAIRPPTIWSW